MIVLSMVRSAGFVVARIRNTAAEFLLLKASQHPFHYSPPKGHVDPGETDREAAARETVEETGIDVNRLRVFENSCREISYIVTESKAHPEDVGKMKTTVYWLALLPPDDFAVDISHEHTQAVWATAEDAHTLIHRKELLEILKDYSTQLLAATS